MAKAFCCEAFRGKGVRGCDYRWLIVGTSAAKMALGFGANVTIIDVDIDRLRYLDDVLDGLIHSPASTKENITNSVTEADLLVGTILVPEVKAPSFVRQETVGGTSPGSVMVDVATALVVGFETSKPTTHSEPVYMVDHGLHFCVTNMPGKLPRVGTQGLIVVTWPYGVSIASKGWQAALKEPRYWGTERVLYTASLRSRS